MQALAFASTTLFATHLDVTSEAQPDVQTCAMTKLRNWLVEPMGIDFMKIVGERQGTVFVGRTLDEHAVEVVGATCKDNCVSSIDLGVRLPAPHDVPVHVEEHLGANWPRAPPCRVRDFIQTPGGVGKAS